MDKTFICKQCGISFTRNVVPSRPHYDYCSRKCSNQARIIPDIECPICSKPFKPGVNDTGGLRKRYCSAKCGAYSRRGRKSHHKTPQWIVDQIRERYPKEGARLLANELGKSETAIMQIAFKNGIKRDTTEQYGIVSAYMRDNNPMKRTEVVEKVRKFWKDNPDRLQDAVTKANLSRSKHMKDQPSKPEYRMCIILNDLSVEYEHQVVIKKGFVVDFRIGNVIIQVDGEYWHGHPRFDPFSERQIKQQSRDRAQDAYLLKCGYTVIRIWERDVNHEYVFRLLSESGLVSP